VVPRDVTRTIVILWGRRCRTLAPASQVRAGWNGFGTPNRHRRAAGLHDGPGNRDGGSPLPSSPDHGSAPTPRAMCPQAC
jgi:hypothetical protein